MIQGAIMCLGRERAVKILHITGQILVFETWSGKPELGIQPPDNLTQEELYKWKILKQHVIQTQ
jgi:hypothetical protein